MDSFEKLIQKAINKDCRLSLRFDPDEPDEQWGIKFFPSKDGDAHFYAYNNNLNSASRQLLDELQGFDKW
jgi:hypothetical protein